MENGEGKKEASKRPKKKGFLSQIHERMGKKNEEESSSSSTGSSGERGSSLERKRDLTMRREKVGDYVLMTKIGKGAFGVVYQALHLFKGNTVAIKHLNLKSYSEERILALTDEIALLQSLDHANIVQYIDHVSQDKNLFIIMEYIENGSLAKMIKNYGYFPESLAKHFVKQILHGLIYLHDQGVIHRDIKPDNILLTKDGAVKLADFGISTKLSAITLNKGEEKEDAPMGTPFYMAPEIIKYHGAKPVSDVWSVGCSIIEFIQGEPPYYQLDTYAAMYRMVEDEHPPIPSPISPALKDFLMQCFRKDVNMRPSARKLLESAWLKDAEDAQLTKPTNLIGKLEQYNEKLNREMGKSGFHISFLSSDLCREDTTQAPPANGGESPLRTKSKKKPWSPHRDYEEQLNDLKKKIIRDDSGAIAPISLSAPINGSPVKEPLKVTRSLEDTSRSSEKDFTAINGILTSDSASIPKRRMSIDSRTILTSFVETSAQDFEDFIEVDSLAKKLDNKMTWDDELILEDDPEEKDDEAMLKEKAMQALQQEIKGLFLGISSNDDPDKMVKALQDLNPGYILSSIVNNHGVLPLIDALSISTQAVTDAALRVITEVICHPEVLINFCVMGAIPVISSLTSKQYTLLTRLYAVHFLQKVVSNNDTLQMLVACRGLGSLSDLLTDSEFEKNVELVYLSVDCISNILKVSSPHYPKQEFIYLFLNCNTPERLSIILLSLAKKGGDSTYLNKISSILRNFSLGDARVKSKLCSKAILSNVKQVLGVIDSTTPETLELLRLVKNLSSDPNTLQSLTPFITLLLDITSKYVKNKKFVTDLFNAVTNALYNLCKQNKGRQEIAVKSGLIPFLMFVIENNRPLKEFAVPLLCELAGSTEYVRSVLLENQGLKFFFSILSDKKTAFHTDALDAIAVCLETELAKSEEFVVHPENLTILKELFIHNSEYQLSYLLDSMTKIFTCSNRIGKEISSSESQPDFIDSIKPLLSHSDPHTRVKLLTALLALVPKYQDPPHFLRDKKLLKIISSMATDDTSNLVRNMAQKLLSSGGTEE